MGPTSSPVPAADFQLLFESAPGLYLVLNPEFNIVAVSDAYLRATRKQREKILGRGLFEIIPDSPEHSSAMGIHNLSASLNRVLQLGVADAMPVQKYDIRRPEAEGGGFEERYWSPVNSAVFGAGKQINYIIHGVEDVTEFVQLKQRGSHHGQLTKELRERVERMEAKIFLRAQEIQEVNRQLREANEALRAEIRERKRAEETIRQLNAELERRVLERTAELAASNCQLQQQNQENEMFVYSVSHDLRSPLVNLEGFSKELGTVCQDLRALLAGEHVPRVVRDRGVALLDSDMAEAIHFIRSGVGRLSNIIDALLRLSRAGRVEYRWQAVEVKTVVARIVESMHATITGQGATVTVADLLPVWGDPVAVEQIFANLISNALNYLDPERPGVIEVGSDHAERVEGTAGPVALRKYYVKDNGLGIPEAYRSKVFQAFQRLHPGLAKGEGIGLTMVRCIIERHGGQIWLESAEAVGSTFWLTLPGPPANGTVDGFEPGRTELIPFYTHADSSDRQEDATWQPSS